MWFWFLLAVVIVVAVGIWDFRRKAARREAASQQRMDLLLKAKTPAPAPAAKSTEPVPQPGADAAPDEPATIVYAARERLLNQSESLIYLLLKSGVPDHGIFPKVPLAAVVEPPGTAYDREQQLRRLSRNQIDFVVCDKAMKIVAAVQLAAMGAEAVVAQRIRSECLKSAGIRLVTIDAASLPKRAEIRALVCGAGEGAAANKPLETSRRPV